MYFAVAGEEFQRAILHDDEHNLYCPSGGRLLRDRLDNYSKYELCGKLSCSFLPITHEDLPVSYLCQLIPGYFGDASTIKYLTLMFLGSTIISGNGRRCIQVLTRNLTVSIQFTSRVSLYSSLFASCSGDLLHLVPRLPR